MGDTRQSQLMRRNSLQLAARRPRGNSSMIQGYPTQPSVLPGETLTLHVSTDAPQFRVNFYRQGQTLTFMGNLGVSWMTGQNIPQGAPNQDWNWPSYAFPIPSNWSSGVYIAMLFEGDGNGNQISSPDTSKADG